VRWQAAPVPLQSRFSRWPTALFVAASWVSFLAAVAIYSPMVAVISLILLLGAVVHELSRFRQVQYAWGIWALLWLVVPLPLQLDTQLITRLQLLSSQLSSRVLDVAGVIHLMEGNSLILPEKELFVDEACSGIVSILSIVACSAIYGVWRNRPPIHVVLLAAMGMGWATLLNVLRISVIAYVFAKFGLDWSSGTPHEILGAVLFLFTFGALAATDLCLVACLTPITEPWREVTAQPLVFGKWFARGFDKLATFGAPQPTKRGPQLPPVAVEDRSRTIWPIAAACLFAAVGGLHLFLGNGDQQIRPTVAVDADPNIKRALLINERTLPTKLQGATLAEHRMQQRDDDHLLGEYSSVFTYVDDDLQTPALVSCDFAYPNGWHELSVCYRGIGWEVLSRQVVSLASPATSAGNQWPLVELTLRKSDGQYAVVAFCGFDADGNSISPPSLNFAEKLQNAFSRRGAKAGVGNCFQVQVMISSPGEPTEARKQQARDLLIAARGKLRDAVVVGTIGGAAETNDSKPEESAASATAAALGGKDG
jgi:exosortase